MKYQIKILIGYIGLLILSTGFSGCSDDGFSSDKYQVGHRFVLTLPVDHIHNISTRSTSGEMVVHNLLVLIIRDGVCEKEHFTSLSIVEEKISLKLLTLDPQIGEKIYIICNTGQSSIQADSEENLLKQITCSHSDSNIMYASVTLESLENVSIPLKYSFAKVSLECSVVGYNIEEWKIINIPMKGFVGDLSGYPAETSYGVGVYAKDSIPTIIPRNDNATAEQTYLLVKMSYGGENGWYRLDFYDGDTPLQATEKPTFLDMKRSYIYNFDILSINSKGYDTEEEAATNTGSNITYNMEVNENTTSSNGQYSLLFDRGEIELYPILGQSDQIATEALIVSAMIPTGSVNNITTYSITLVNPSGQIKLAGDDDSDNVIDLMKGDKLTTENSKREIQLTFNGADVSDSYVVVQLGNIIDKVPISVQTSNCYIFDFSSGVNTLYIPIAKANEGKVRVGKLDDVVLNLVWCDQANVSFAMSYDKDKQWIVVTNDIPFTGNAVIEAKVKGVTVWSWHIWSMTQADIEIDTKKGIYNLKPAKYFSSNGYTWMDRNLGAYDLTPYANGSRGLTYQWGRKDPFPGAATGDVDSTIEELMIYVGSQSFTMKDKHPITGLDCIVYNDSPNNLEYSIQNPYRFIITNTKGYQYPSTSEWDADWLTNIGSTGEKEIYLWVAKDGSKAAYNPCPIGWTLPDGGIIGPWAGFVSETATINSDGLTWNKIGYFPYTAVRNMNNGELKNQGTQFSESIYWWGNYRLNCACISIISGAAIASVSSSFRMSANNLRCVRE